MSIERLPSGLKRLKIYLNDPLGGLIFMDENKINLFAISNLELEDNQESPKGSFSGIAYSGKPIKYHGGLENLVLDVESMNFKEQVPVFLNHNSNNYIGKAQFGKESGALKVKGSIFQKENPLGQEVQAKAMEGALWELSVGLGFSNFEEVKKGESTTVNGIDLSGPAMVVRNSRVIEVSFVAVGADDSTSVTVRLSKENSLKLKENLKMSEKNKEINTELKAWEEFACSCTGKKEAKLSDVDEKIKKLEDENEEMKKELKKYRDAEKKKKMSAILSEKGVELSEEKLTEYTSDDSKYETYLSFLGDLPAKKEEPKKIDPKFAKKTEVETGVSKVVLSKDDQIKQRIVLAEEKVKSGEFKSVTQALARMPMEEI